MTAERAGGVLLHPSSLPGPHGSGDFGAAAYHFVDWLAVAGQRLWQILPLGPLGPGASPYMSPSAFGLNPLMVDLDDLVRRGWLAEGALRQAADEAGLSGGGDPRRIDFARVAAFRGTLLRAAARSFLAQPAADPEYAAFCEREREWLEEYAAFMAIVTLHPRGEDWPPALRRREPEALRDLCADHAGELEFWKFVQWVAARQWAAVRDYARGKGVRIIGDIPIFVAPDSVDVWAHPELFELDGDLRPGRVAGVPPDYFSDTGQRWGNPLYRWARHRASGFAWWIRRLRAALGQADLVRIDHFRGFAAGWSIPADAADARAGEWRPGPGAALFTALRAALGDLPIIAEDLGVITEDVVALRERFRLPGMRVLQFAFEGDPGNPYLPHNYRPDTVVYTGTHDNDTSRGWFATASERERAFACSYLNCGDGEIEWNLIHAASSSVAATAIYPFQDILGLGSEARMNRPSQPDGCWTWRFEWSQVRDWHATRLRRLSAAHGRCTPG